MRGRGYDTVVKNSQHILRTPGAHVLVFDTDEKGGYLFAGDAGYTPERLTEAANALLDHRGLSRKDYEAVIFPWDWRILFSEEDFEDGDFAYGTSDCLLIDIVRKANN